MHTAVEEDRKCKWALRAMVKANTEDMTIIQANPLHVCEIVDRYTCRMHSNSDRLADHIIEIIIIKNRATHASTLRDTTQALVHPDIHYHTAHATKKRCITWLDGSDKESFFLILVHCHHILKRDLGATTKYPTPNNHFEILFVCPFASCHAWDHLRTFFGFDGTHIKCS